MDGPVRLDNPPPPPPGVSAQMGGGSGDDPSGEIARRLSQQKPEGEGGGDMAKTMQANPKGALVASVSAIEKLLRQAARMTQEFAPYALRAIEILRKGLGDVMKPGEA